MEAGPRPSALFLTQHYWPESIGSAPYCTDMAECLSQNGMNVTVFTCQPHYPAGKVDPDYQDGSGDRQIRAGVKVERVPPFLRKGRGAVGRMIADGIYLLKGLAGLATGRIKRSDTVASLCPSILTVLLGAVATKRGGYHVATVHDIPSGLAAGLGMIGSGHLTRAMRWLERVVLNRTDVVMVLSDNMRRHLRELGVTVPIEILPLWVDTVRIHPVERRADAATTVLYSGNFGKKQALGQIVEMAQCLKRENTGISVVLRGDGSEAIRLADEVSALGLDNVRFAPLVPAERLNDGLAEGDIYLVPQDGTAADFAVPSKLFAIMAAGRPLVASARPGSLLWQLMEQSHAFLCVPAGDAKALAEGVKELAADPQRRRELGQRGRSYILAHHDKSTLLEAFFDRITSVRRPQVLRSPAPAASSGL
jgi:colanic acid biosynthesis glycosyl transferase WcaI